ncbi:MAG: hypothetical protein GY729_16480 [Desulfobacteraceae bacterium]|nr:hypothetical protein [Desulfobacteraceae bacterium]
MSNEIKGILQKINFIETDMELHKQILVSIPSNNKKDMEKVLKKIAEQKKQIEDLKLKIKEIDSDEYNRIIAIETAAQKFKQLSMNKKFVTVNTLNEAGECFIRLKDGTSIECLVTAQEENGDWTVLTLDGETRELSKSEVQ